MRFACLLLSIILFQFEVEADLPGHCTLPHILGKWELKVSAPISDPVERLCGHHRPDSWQTVYDRNDRYDAPQWTEGPTDTKKYLNITDEYKDTAMLCSDADMTQDCDEVEFTLVYDEGIHLQYEHNSETVRILLFFRYEPKNAGEHPDVGSLSAFITDCGNTYTGWYSTDRSETRGCVIAKNLSPPADAIHSSDGTGGTYHTQLMVQPVTLQLSQGASHRERLKHLIASNLGAIQTQDTEIADTAFLEKEYEFDISLIEAINNDKNIHWSAHKDSLKFFKGKTNREMQLLRGNRHFQHSIIIDNNNNKKKNNDGKSIDAINDLQYSLSINDILDPIAKQAEENRRQCIKNKLPGAFDWKEVDPKYVGDIVSQGSCGSCYAAASSDSMSLRLKIADKKYDDKASFSLSIQQVIDCSYTNQGCDGGFPFLVGWHAQSNGIQTTECVPYTEHTHSNAQNANTCDVDYPAGDKCEKVFASSYEYVGGSFGKCNEADMMYDIYTNGPTIVALDAPNSLFYYSGGIFDGVVPASHTVRSESGASHWEKTNHAVLVTGWGVENGVNFWIVKNSWGKDWGESGYFRVKRGVNLIAIENMAVSIKFEPKDGSFIKSNNDVDIDECSAMI